MNGEHRTTTARRHARALLDFERRLNAVFRQDVSLTIEACPSSNPEEACSPEMSVTADQTSKNIFFLNFFNQVCMETNVHAENEPPVRIFRHGRRKRCLSVDSDSATDPQQKYTMCVSCNFRHQGI